MRFYLRKCAAKRLNCPYVAALCPKIDTLRWSDPVLRLRNHALHEDLAQKNPRMNARLMRGGIRSAPLLMPSSLYLRAVGQRGLIAACHPTPCSGQAQQAEAEQENAARLRHHTDADAHVLVVVVARPRQVGKAGVDRSA